MSHYLTQEASFELPDAFKDRTMNIFTLSENNASEFTFVVSRANARVEDTLQKVAARLTQDLQTTVQGFELISSSHGNINQQPSIEIFYRFKSAEALIWQKQNIVLLKDELQGRKIVCFIGTCQNSFNDYYDRQYKGIIASIIFNEKENDTHVPVMLATDSVGNFFVFDTDSKELSVFTAISELYQHIDLNRALNGSYLFYHSLGEPLHIAPVSTNSSAEFTRYALWTSSVKNNQHLSSILLLCRSVNGPQELSNPEQIAEYLRTAREP